MDKLIREYDNPSLEPQSLVEAALNKPKDSAQTVYLQTASGKVYTAVNPLAAEGNFAAEDALLQQLTEQKDTRVLWVCAVWHGACVDLPSFHLRQRLLELLPANKDTRILLVGEGGYGYRSIDSTMPDKNRGKG